MTQKIQILTEHIGFRVSHAILERIRQRAEADGKIVSDWCRERAIQAADQRTFSPSEYALVAEIAATQSILIDLLCSLGHDGKLSQQKAQAIVDAAHRTKYMEAAELLTYTYEQFHSGAIEVASGTGTGRKR